MASEVYLSKRSEKQLSKIPQYIARKFQAWVEAVEELGLDETRKVPGYHDEALIGNRKGQRSARLSRAYRIIYQVEEKETDPDTMIVIEIVTVEEITKHDY